MLVDISDPTVDSSPELLGGKGYGLLWMQKNNINVPPALVIPTTVCMDYMRKPKTTIKKIAGCAAYIEKFFKLKFGYVPLLSVRSGARVSMPGMMDTILNIGLDQKTEQFWRNKLGDSAYSNSLHRLVTMYGSVVHGISRHELEKDDAISALSVFHRETGIEFPSFRDQLVGAIEAVFKSWNNERAKVYRKMNNIPNDWGTAVVIQAMVFGNLNENSGTGVLFTRDPDNGEDKVVGEFLINAQGEDVVAGIRTPMPLSKMVDWNPEVSKELMNVVTKLEWLKRDAQDVEFTIQDGKLFILQTRNAKRSAAAAVKIAFDMVTSGLITKDEMFKRVSQRELDLANLPVISKDFNLPPDFVGIPACSGIRTGVVALSSETAVTLAASGNKVILVTEETTPDDISGMAASIGVLTMTGGSTSHAAVVARSMNKPCVVGLGKEYHSKFTEGSKLSIDGATGRVWFGEVPVVGGVNPLVAQFKSELLKGTPLIVESAPEFHVEHLVLELGNVLHYSLDTIIKTTKECLQKCSKLDFVVSKGISTDFYTEAAFNKRARDVLGHLKIVLGDMYSTVIGLQVDGYMFVPIVGAGSDGLENLVMATTDVMVMQSIAQANQSPAFIKVMDWLKKDGVSVSSWNTKGQAGPKYYSLAVQK